MVMTGVAKVLSMSLVTMIVLLMALVLSAGGRHIRTVSDVEVLSSENLKLEDENHLLRAKLDSVTHEKSHTVDTVELIRHPQ